MLKNIFKHAKAQLVTVDVNRNDGNDRLSFTSHCLPFTDEKRFEPGVQCLLLSKIVSFIFPICLKRIFTQHTPRLIDRFPIHENFRVQTRVVRRQWVADENSFFSRLSAKTVVVFISHYTM